MSGDTPSASKAPEKGGSCCYNFFIWGLRGYRLYLKWCIVIFYLVMIIMSVSPTMCKDFLRTNKAFFERAPLHSEVWLKQQVDFNTSMGGICIMLAVILTPHRPTRLLLIILEMIRIALAMIGGPGQLLLELDPALPGVVNIAFARDVQFVMYAVLFGVSTLALGFELFFYNFDSPNEREPGFFDFLWEDETLGGEKLSEMKKKEEDDKAKAKVE